MKKINSQLNDANIIALTDACTSGVDFSNALQMAEIPEMLADEAKQYWNVLKMQNEMVHQIFPEDSIVDSIIAKMDAPVSERIVKEITPSPYMKYVMAFAAPISILVMIVGITLRDKPNELNIEDTNGLKPLSSELTKDTQNVEAIAPRMAKRVAINSDVAPSATNMKMMAVSAAMPEAADIKNTDPKQLFAMLSDAGSYESLPDTTIDEEFDAKLSELDSKVIDSNNVNPYENQ